MRSKLLDDERILIHLETGYFFALRGSGVRAWELLEKGVTAGDLVDKLLPDFQVDRARLARDIDSLLRRLRRHDLIVEEPGSPDAPA